MFLTSHSMSLLFGVGVCDLGQGGSLQPRAGPGTDSAGSFQQLTLPEAGGPVPLRLRGMWAACPGIYCSHYNYYGSEDAGH